MTTVYYAESEKELCELILKLYNSGEYPDLNVIVRLQPQVLLYVR